MRRALSILAVVALLLAGAVAYALTRDPAPDFAGQPRQVISDYMLSGDFDAHSDATKQAILNDYLDRYEGVSFNDLAAIAFSGDPKKDGIIAAIRDLPRDQRNQIWDRVGKIGLDAYWREPAAKRQAVLTMFALAQQGQIAMNPDAFPLPTEGEFRADMARIMSRQDPKTQARGGQFLMDLRQTRQSLGLRDRF